MRSSSVRSGASPPVPNALSCAHGVDPEPAPGALVGERGVDEAVEQHAPPGGQQRPQPLLDELGTGGRVDQRLGAGADRQRRVLDQRAQPLGQLHAARLAQHLDVAERRRQPGHQRRLAGAVDPLDA